MAKAAGSPTQRRSWFWLQGMICGVVAVVAPGTAVTIGILLAPGLAMLATEQQKGRPVSRAMLLMGAASCFMPLRLLWEQGGSLEAALTLLGDPARPLFSWAASGAGWLSGQFTEISTRLLLDARAAQKLRAIKQEQEILIAEWTDGCS